ncbi:MAG: class I SAM-dependent methyltransferase [Candidatus Nanopelagicales bacterium]
MSDHTVFTRVYRGLSAVGERTGLGDLRRRVLADAHGRLLIIGLGPGHDLDHLPAAVTSVVALEPSASMRAAARSRVDAAARRGVEVDVIDAVAEQIPLPNSSVDSVLVAYVLCSVADPHAAAAEIRRVLPPGGTLHVLEHVRAEPGTALRGLQRAVGPVWPRLAGGCRVDRDTAAVLESAGFDLSAITRTRLMALPPVAPTLVGVARPRSTRASN